MEIRMPSTVRQQHAAREERLDAILHALSHQTRRSILAQLATGPAMVRELAAPFAATRVAISKHVRVLERARLIKRTVDGRVHRCTLSPSPLREVESWLADYRSFWNDKLKSLARYVEQSEAGRSEKKLVP
jgi:DNA-binding transcriptional ArsR family regulator